LTVTGFDAEQLRGFRDRQEAAGPESIVAWLELVLTPQPFDEHAVKRSPGARHVARSFQSAPDERPL
jgi:hypothetical protein